MADVVRTKELVLKELGQAYQKGDMKQVSKLAGEIAKLDAASESAEREAKVKALADKTIKVKSAIDKAVQKFMDDGSLDVADGVWYSYDFGTKESTCKLSKGTAKKAGTGGGSGSYVSRPEKTADLIAQVGSHPMFKEETVVTIDKVEHTMKAGTTLKEAFDYSNNGGWRNRVRMALLKEAGLI